MFEGLWGFSELIGLFCVVWRYDMELVQENGTTVYTENWGGELNKSILMSIPKYNMI